MATGSTIQSMCPHKTMIYFFIHSDLVAHGQYHSMIVQKSIEELKEEKNNTLAEFYKIVNSGIRLLYGLHKLTYCVSESYNLVVKTPLEVERLVDLRSRVASIVREMGIVRGEHEKHRRKEPNFMLERAEFMRIDISQLLRANQNIIEKQANFFIKRE
jgi:hypothetical protein